MLPSFSSPTIVFPQTEASIANSEGFLETKVGSPGSQFLYEKDAPLTGDDQVSNFVVQLNPAIAHFKGLVKIMHSIEIFVIANV